MASSFEGGSDVGATSDETPAVPATIPHKANLAETEAAADTSRSRPTEAAASERIYGVLGHVLTENRGGFLSLGMFAHYVRMYSPVDGRLKSTIMRHLENALAGGLLRAGDVAGDRFYPWVDSYVRNLERIERAWPDESEPSFEALRDVCWLVNTPAGDRQVDYYHALRAAGTRHGQAAARIQDGAPSRY